MTTLLEVRNLSVQSTAGKPVLKNVSLSLDRGEIVALIGASGSGKTTLALAALGHLRPGLQPISGEALYHGRDLLAMDDRTIAGLRGKSLAYIAQSAAVSFNPRISLLKQVTESSRIHHTMPRKTAEDRARATFTTLDLPKGDAFFKRYPHQVSGGQLQRFMIAMGLQEMPEVLVCDEPTSALDATTQVEVLKALKAGIHANNTAAILVAHDIAQVVQVATHVLVMRNGEVVERGTVSNILDRPQHAYTKQLLGMHRSFDTVKDRPAVPASEDPLLLEVRDLGVRYGPGSATITALQGASLQLRRREMIAIVGESGSGKSTFARAIAGLVKASSGEVLLAGRPLERNVLDRPLDLRKSVQITFQSADTSLNRHHSVGKILGQVLKFFGETSKPRRDERIRELLDYVHLPAEYMARKPSQMSGGEKQRVNLARSLAANPDVLICDEITSALDNIVADSILKLIDELKERLSVGILFISHDLSAVAAMSNRIMVLRNGKVVEQGDTGDVLFKPQHPYTQLLRASVSEMRVGWLEEAASFHQDLRARIDS